MSWLVWNGFLLRFVKNLCICGCVIFIKFIFLDLGWVIVMLVVWIWFDIKKFCYYMCFCFFMRGELLW